MSETFGSYELIAKIGEGAMAEVFLARKVGELAGFEKEVALKRIFPNLTDRQELVSMFLDEARIAAQLSHPNIVQVYDLGKVDDSLFIAMEYVRGHDLQDILETGQQRDDFLPMELAVRIVSDAAAGLHHAHTSTDAEGNPRNIVHRDVSPQNILVGMDGQVKVTDFGIAKAEDRLSETRAGQRKGKLSYMSPEQFEATSVDRRSDVYTLGIVLYETTTRTRLFRGRSDFETMSMVSEARVDPPSSVRPGFPADLEPIVMAALQKDPAQRLQSAEELYLLLEDWLQQRGAPSGRGALGEYMSRLYPEGAGVDRQPEASKKAPAAAAAPPQSAAPTSQRPAPAPGPGSGGPPGSSGPPAGARPPQASHPAAPAGGPRPAAAAAAGGTGAAEADGGGWDPELDEGPQDFANRRSMLFAGLGVLAAVITLGIVAYSMLTTEKDLATDEQKAFAKAKAMAAEQADEVPEPPPSVEVPLATEPAGAAVVINGLRAEAKTPGTFDLVADEANEVIFYHPQYPPKRVIVSGDASEKPEAFALEPFAAEPETGALVIHSDPEGGIVYIDGERLGAAPQTVEDAVAGHDHHVEVRMKGRWSFAGFFQVVPGERNAFQVSLAPKDSAGRRQYVEVTYDVVPRDTAVTVDGTLRGSSRVVLNQKRNEHIHVELAKPNYREQDRYLLLHGVGTFTMRTFLEERTREKGKLTVRVEPSEAKIYIGANAYDTNPVERLELYEGKHTVVVETPDGQRYETRLEVYPGMANVYELEAAAEGLEVERVD